MSAKRFFLIQEEITHALYKNTLLIKKKLLMQEDDYLFSSSNSSNIGRESKGFAKLVNCFKCESVWGSVVIMGSCMSGWSAFSNWSRSLSRWFFWYTLLWCTLRIVVGGKGYWLLTMLITEKKTHHCLFLHLTLPLACCLYHMWRGEGIWPFNLPSFILFYFIFDISPI